MEPRPLPSCLLVLVLFLVSLYPQPSSAVKNETVCKNVDIRNTVANFKRIENCTVIEGYLQIILIDNGQIHDYEGLSFPDLVEITGYFLLWRAFGLNSVGKIFPNLAVIRGNILFHNYAFVVFEMSQLQEIGLNRLTDILRGSVRIEKNPGLCYVNTVEWDLIAHEGKGGHFIKDNKKNDECPNVCPGPGLCPSILKNGKMTSLCWNSQKCQKLCDIVCEKNSTCSSRKGFCCQQECLGGCYGTTAYDCVSCKHVLFDGKCLKKCPPGTFELIGRRCVQERECRNYDEKDSNNNVIYWKPFMGQCIQECPPGYVEAINDKHVCNKCSHKCPKICNGMVVDHVGAAQKIHGCTIINGSLEIHIRGGSNIIKELEESMSLIEEIHGYLKIARSYPLVSLNFLKSLTIIHGNELDKRSYSFLVLDNQNLQELWDWNLKKEPISIKKGKIFFHFNSKLCLSKIQEFAINAELLPWDDRDVSPSSNGDRVACDVTNMNISVKSLTPTEVEIVWESYHKYMHDERSVLGYVVYYRQTLNQNISMYDGWNACGSDVWIVREVELSDYSLRFISYKIRGLRPFTQYALYIKSYTTASSTKSAQSSIQYFKTDPDTPSPPLNIKARSTLHNEIVISWDPPKLPNGNVTHYFVEGIYDDDFSSLTNQRNYCLEPISYPDYNTYDDSKKIHDMDYLNSSTTENTKPPDKKCCSCSNGYQPVSYDDEEAEFQIHFEDFLQNNLYLRNPNVYRQKRDISVIYREGRSILFPESFGSKSTVPTAKGDKFLNDYLYHFRRSVYNRPFLVMSNLKHFTEYTIEIQACQDFKPNQVIDPCSAKAITSVRTLALDDADDIKSDTLKVVTENITRNTALIKWEEPKDPNGVIVAYIIAFHRVDGQHLKPINRICVTRSNYQQHNGYLLEDLTPGNYALRVKANSLAKYGNWSNYIYFSISPPSDASSWQIILIVILLFLVGVILCVLYGIYRWKFKQRIPDYIDYASVNPEYMSSNWVYEPDEWEIPREKIKLLVELGQGSFGMVYKGEVHDLNGNSFTPCAAKTVNETATLRERIEFLQEASVMKAFNCNHVIKLLGVVSKGQPTLVIMELMTNGDLKSYLRSHRPDSEENNGQKPPTMRQILQMASEIADGMAYLSAKKFVHRDLAARNCMVADDLTVKIGDFGMTRDVYETDYYRKGGKGFLPVRWMAPESLKDGIFDSQSDVWSFGVVLWEMATLASQPYQGLSNEEVLKYVVAGNTMKKPEDCPEKLFDLMVICWQRNPKARPTFVEIVEMLLPDISSKFHHTSYYFTQHPRMSPADAEDTATPTTPLRLSVRDEDSYDQNAYRYFPSLTQMPEEHFNHYEHDDAQPSASNYRANVVNSNEGSKGISVNYSDGSKESKISNVSNGSIVNGHLSINMARDTEC